MFLFLRRALGGPRLWDCNRDARCLLLVGSLDGIPLASCLPRSSHSSSLQYPDSGQIGANTILKWWGNTVYKNTADANSTPLRTVSGDDYFGCVSLSSLTHLDAHGSVLDLVLRLTDHGRDRGDSWTVCFFLGFLCLSALCDSFDRIVCVVLNGVSDDEVLFIFCDPPCNR